MATEVLGRRALNRALLERQLLLSRVNLPVPEAVEHLVGLQAQASLPPYQGLWSRLEGFDPHDLGRLLVDREAVRLTLMRGTVHLVTVRDALVLRPLVQRAIERTHSGTFARRMGGADLGALVEAVRELLADEPLTARELGRKLVERGIGDDVEAIGNAARVYVPLVQVPPRGVWGAGGQAKYATIEAWTGRELHPRPSLDDSGAALPPSLRPGVGHGRPELVRADEARRGARAASPPPRDVPRRARQGALRPAGGATARPGDPAPVRFLGEYDNILLGHADRRRIIPEDFPWQAMLAPGRFVSNLLVEGILRATWWIERDGKRSATLAVRPFRKLSRREREEVEAEAQAMIDFSAAEAERRDLRFEPAVI